MICMMGMVVIDVISISQNVRKLLSNIVLSILHK